jgi:hypothetical protein
MSYRGDIRLGDTIDIKFPTRRFSTGAPFTLAGTPSVAAYVGNGTTEITAGITLTVDFDARTGLNNVRVVASGGNGFAAGTNVDLVITAGTVDGVSVVGEVVGSFSIENRSAVMPTTAGRTLAIETDGMAHADVKEWNGSTTPVTNLNTVFNTDFAVNYDPNRDAWIVHLRDGAIHGNAYDAAGADITFQECQGALINFNLDHLMGFACTGDDVVDNSALAKLVSKSATADWDSFVNTTDALEAHRLYHADIHFTRDQTNTRDEYTITWFKNGVRVTSGITVPTLQVVKRADGADLIASTTPTQIGATGSYKHDEATNRMTVGEAAIAIVTATIDGSSRSFARVISRDSS